MASVTKAYNDIDVGGIFKQSEALGGHPESRHSMGGSGKRRPKIDDQGLGERMMEEASAYAAGHQVPATVACLNSPTGQEGLQALDGGARRVTLTIGFAGLAPPPPPFPFRARVATSELFTLPFTNLQSKGGQDYDDVVPTHGIVVMEKRGYGLHIVTSYPSRTPPGGLGAAASDLTVQWT